MATLSQLPSESPDPTAARPGSGEVVGRVDRFQQRHPAVGVPLAVLYKRFDDEGSSLAALITYYAFVSLFPLLLLASTVLGLVLSGHPDLQQRVLDSALSQLPVVGDDLGRPGRLSGGVLAIVIGALGALYGGMGVAQAVQNAANAAWTVQRNERPNPFLVRVRSIGLLAIISADVVGTSVLAGITGAVLTGALARTVVVAGTFVVHATAFALVFRFATTRDLSWRDVAPGALVAGLGWLGLQYVGVAYVSRTVNNANATTGVFAVVLGLLAFLYLASTLVVMTMELNVVLVDRLWPRTLLTPVTDNVVLTEADKRSYTDLATAQTLKGFQRVEVDFDEPPRHGERPEGE